jgi:hypothetical protein
MKEEKKQEEKKQVQPMWHLPICCRDGLPNCMHVVGKKRREAMKRNIAL